MAAQSDPRKHPAFAGGQAGDGDPDEAARFLADHLTDLVVLARRHGFAMLAYLLDMAKLEAEEVARRASTERGGRR